MVRDEKNTIFFFVYFKFKMGNDSKNDGIESISYFPERKDNLLMLKIKKRLSFV